MKWARKLHTSFSKFNPVMMLFYGLIMGAAGYIIITSRAAVVPPAPPTIYLNPTSQTFAVNTTFTVEVRENSATTPVNAVQANFTYPANLLDFVSISGTNSAFTTEAPSSGGNGQISIARGLIGSVTGDQLVAVVTFRTKAVGGTANLAFSSGTLLVNATTNQDILGSLTRTGGVAITVDTTPPTVGVTQPTANAVLSNGSNVTINATATDASQVTGVEFIIDGTVRSTDTTSPYSYTWPTAGVALGAHTIQARASDPYGNTGTSATTTVTLADQTAPTTSITAPTSGGAALTGSVTITANATDNAGGTGVNRVEFYIDGTLRSTDTTSPYSYTWDTKTVLDGTHSLSVRAYDNATPANMGTSSVVSVSVDNSDRTPPSAPASLRTTTTTLNSIALAWNASTDNVGVTGYRLQRNGTTIYTGTALAFTDSNLASGTAYTYSVVAFDAMNNFSTSTTLSASTVAVKPGDVNADNKVDIFDLSILLARWATTDAAADINKNGTVDIFDLSILLANFGK